MCANLTSKRPPRNKISFYSDEFKFFTPYREELRRLAFIVAYAQRSILVCVIKFNEKSEQGLKKHISESSDSYTCLLLLRTAPFFLKSQYNLR